MKLHEQLKVKNAIIKAYEEGIEEIRSYLSLPKFHWPDNQVNISDIFLRVNELKNHINDIEVDIENKIERELKPGRVVNIYEDPITEKKVEGSAKLIKCLIKRDDEKKEYWRVKFLSDKYTTSERWIKKPE